MTAIMTQPTTQKTVTLGGAKITLNFKPQDNQDALNKAKIVLASTTSKTFLSPDLFGLSSGLVRSDVG